MTEVTKWTYDKQLEMLQLVNYSYEMTAACLGGACQRLAFNALWKLRKCALCLRYSLQGLEYPGTSGRQLLLHGSPQGP